MLFRSLAMTLVLADPASIALGWQGIHHVSAEGTAAQLRALGVSF